MKKVLSFLLDFIGIFYLSSFLTLTLFLSFWAELSPTCYMTDALIAYMECGKGFLGGALKTYFLLFSALSIQIAMLSGYGLITSLGHLNLEMFFGSLFHTTILAIFYFSSVRILIKIIKKILRHRKSLLKEKESKIALIQLLAIIFPLIISSALYVYLVPFENPKRIVEVDLWHDKYEIPRIYLEKWSLTKKAKPEKEPSPFFRFNRGGRSAYPYAVFKIPYKELGIDENKGYLEVSVRPHYNPLTDEELYKSRLQKVEQIKKNAFCYYKKERKRKDCYNRPFQKEGEWSVLTPDIPKEGNSLVYKLYLQRNKNGQIESLLKCMPDSWCVKTKNRKGKISEYYGRCDWMDECEKCKRVCDESSNTNKYNISYKLNKQHIDNYSKIHQSILNFIESYSVK